MTDETVAALRKEVADGLDAWRRQRDGKQRSASDGVPESAPGHANGDASTDEERVYAQELIRQTLERDRKARLLKGTDPLSPVERERVARALDASLFGLGDALEELLADPAVENVNANGADDVWVTYVGGKKERVGPIAASDEELEEKLRLAAARLGRNERRFDAAWPRLHLQLPQGARLSAFRKELAGRTILCIRRHRFDLLFLADLVENGTLDPVLADFLGACVRARKNLIVCGGVDAGKTTLLRILCNEIPPLERLVTIEDSLELALTHDLLRGLHHDVVELEAREPNIEGKGEVTLLQLVRDALRMDPDRIIVGEVRDVEAVAMLRAMNAGNDGSMCSVHARSSLGAFKQLAMYAKPVQEDEITYDYIGESLHFVVHIEAHGEVGEGHTRRFVSSVREVTGAEGGRVVSNEIWRPGADGRAALAVVPSARTLVDLEAAGFDRRLLTYAGSRP